MKCLIVLLTIVAFTAVGNATRAKRFAGFGTFSTVGGRVGCVVSENGPGNSSLYINSHFTKFLSEDEQQELEQYKEKLAQFKTDVKTFLEERQKQALERRDQFGRGAGSFSGRNTGFGANTGRGQQQISDDAAISSSTTTAAADSDDNRTGTSQSSVGASASKQPEPPKKPSFCSEKSTTQYVFDGCSVQGDSVFIGDNFVRKLTEKEQSELEQFDKQFTAYQKAVTNNFKQQVQDIFGKNFGSLFETSSSSKSTDASAIEPSSETPSAQSTAAAPQQLEAPKTPNFCTLIV